MYIVQTVPPANEPISLADAKTFMRMLGIDEDDTLIESMIAASREYAENYTNRQFESATFELYLSCFEQDLKLPKNPIKTISKIEYMDEDGNYQILADTNYYLYGENDIFKVHFEDTESHKEHKNAIKITFASGYTTVPTSIISWMKIKVSTLYEHREQFVVGVPINEFSDNLVNKMLDFYKIRSI